MCECSRNRSNRPTLIPLPYTDETGPGATMYVALEQVAAVRRDGQATAAVLLASGVSLPVDLPVHEVLRLLGEPQAPEEGSR